MQRFLFAEPPYDATANIETPYGVTINKGALDGGTGHEGTAEAVPTNWEKEVRL